jgi:hypothetical protein
MCMVGLLYALPTTQFTRRLAREGRLFPPSYAMRLAAEEGAGDQCTTGLNFATARPRRDVLHDYRTVLERIYRPAAFYARVRSVARSLDRPTLDRNADRDPPVRRLMGVPLGDFGRLGRLVHRMAMRQPGALWPFARAVWDCARTNPRALDCVFMLAAFFLHLGPFSRFVIASIDRQIAQIDAGTWQPPQVLEPHSVKGDRDAIRVDRVRLLAPFDGESAIVPKRTHAVQPDARVH